MTRTVTTGRKQALYTESFKMLINIFISSILGGVPTSLLLSCVCIVLGTVGSLSVHAPATPDHRIYRI